MRGSLQPSRPWKIGTGHALVRLVAIAVVLIGVMSAAQAQTPPTPPAPEDPPRSWSIRWCRLTRRWPILAAVFWSGWAISQTTASTACSAPTRAAAALPKARNRRATAPGSRATAIARQTARLAISLAIPERPGAGSPASARGWHRASISDCRSTRAVRRSIFRWALQSATIDLTQIGFTASVDSGPWTWASAVVHGFGNINSRRDTGFGFATAGYNARLNGVLSEVSYYWTRDQGRIVPKAAFEYVQARTGSLQEIGGLDPATATGATVQREQLLIGAEIGHYWIFDRKIFDISGYGKFVDNLVQNFSDITVSQGVQSITFQGIGESRYGADAGASGFAQPDEYGAGLRELRRQIPRGDAIASGHAGGGVRMVGRCYPLSPLWETGEGCCLTQKKHLNLSCGETLIQGASRHLLPQGGEGERSRATARSTLTTRPFSIASASRHASARARLRRTIRGASRARRRRRRCRRRRSGRGRRRWRSPCWRRRGVPRSCAAAPSAVRRSRPIGVAARLFDLRQGIRIAGEAALHGGDDVGAPFGAVKAFRQRARREALQ